jgi:hypothetical protein
VAEFFVYNYERVVNINFASHDACVGWKCDETSQFKGDWRIRRLAAPPP